MAPDGGEGPDGEQSLIEEREELCRLSDKLQEEDEITSSSVEACKRIQSILEQYQEQSSLLDPFLHRLGQGLGNFLLHSEDKDGEEGFRALYILCKVRGYKVVSKVLAHEVDLFERIAYRLLKAVESVSSCWEEPYVLYIWMYKLAMVPFDLKSIDSSGDLTDRLLAQAKKTVQQNDRPSQGASEFLAQLLSRKDMQSHLESVVKWCMDNEEIPKRIYLLSKLLKHGSRSFLREFMRTRLDRASELCDLSNAKTSLERLYRLKFAQRTALLLLPPKIASWRYQRGSRILFQGNQDTGARDSSCDVDKTAQEDLEVLGWFLSLDKREVQFIEDSVDILLNGLEDKDTVVRWSAAKGLGRITGRLPQVLAREVCEAILSAAAIEDRNERRLHGSCLTLAEMARRGLILPGDGMLESLVQIAVQGLHFDQRRAAASVASQVRDAACFVCWAVARAYSASDVSRFGSMLASNLIQVALFDREISCRRAASAALQECVGRFDGSTIPHGLDLLPLLDFYCLADRKANYLTVSVAVSQLGSDRTYLVPLVEELLNNKTGHWDENVRELAARGLDEICATCDHETIEYVASTLVTRAATAPELDERHGALLGCAYCAKSCDTEGQLADSLRALILESRPKLPGGSPGQMLRIALCELVAELGTHKFLRKIEALNQALEIVRDALSSFDERTLQSGVRAATSLAGVSNDLREELVLLCIARSTMPGLALLGKFLPDERLVEPLLQSALGAKDPETRRNAVRAYSAHAREGLVPIEAALNSLVRAAGDYAVDNRGDVGSWVREAAVTEMADFVSKCESFGVASHAVAAIVRQLMERLDRTRGFAAKSLQTVFQSDSRFTNVAQVLGPVIEDPKSTMVFQTAPSLYEIDFLLESVLLGIASSAGGMGAESSHAQESLLRFPDIDFLVELYESHRGDRRMSVPLLLALERLVGGGGVVDGPWSLRCADGVCQDLRGSRDIARISATIRLLGSLSEMDTSKERSRRALVNLLAHPLPRARRLAAETLYLQVIVLEDEDNGDLTTILGETSWENLSVEESKVLRDQVGLALSSRE